MKKYIFILFMFLGLILNAQSAKSEKINWLTDFDKAQKIAKKEHKPMLLLFTGSDWCHYCIAMKRELFKDKIFIDLSKKFVLVYVDFPRRKPMSDTQRRNNYMLAQKFHHGGIPAMVFLSTDAMILYKSLGYMRGKPEEKLKIMEKVLKLVKDYDKQLLKN